MSEGFVGGISQRTAGRLDLSVFTCPGTVSVGDLVFAIGPDSVDKANAASRDTTPAVGFVVEKPSATRCFIARRGTRGGYTGLVVGQTIYLSDVFPGTFVTVQPTTNTSYLQIVGETISPTEVLFEVDITLSPVNPSALESNAKPSTVEYFTISGTPALPVTFYLAHLPTNALKTTLYVNGILMVYGPDFTVSHAAVTYYGPVALGNGDVVTIEYYYVTVGPASDAIPDTEYFSPGFDGQTVFTLAQTPYQNDQTTADLNGVEVRYGADFIVAGDQVFWIGAYALQTTDVLAVNYFFIPP